jgi:hypothetical protein
MPNHLAMAEIKGVMWSDRPGILPILSPCFEDNQHFLYNGENVIMTGSRQPT